MTRAGPCLIITFTLLAFLVVLASFITVNFNQKPEQDISLRTGYPLWHPPIEGYDQQIIDAVSIFTTLVTSLSGYYIMKWLSEPAGKKYTTIFVLDDYKTVTTEEFNYFLGIYALLTALPTFFIIWFDVGKLWSAIGIFHNVSEVIIMLAMHQGGRIISSASIGWLILYAIFASTLSLALSWPLDAVWFKMQGLCSDFAICIQFTRTYFATKAQMRTDAAERDPIHSEEMSTEERNSRHDPIVYFPHQLLLLILASLVHIVGNSITTFYVSQFTYSLFIASQSVVFTTYAYYVYLDTRAKSVSPQRVIHLPDTAGWKVATVTISSITLSLLVTRIAFAIASSN
ncbi:6921_t:CDS:2 [Acaulospora morrowiae]|uniref:6921_t:CDS:1 n=1 Tax=Acaulospora morrowiae TaxID=94023 RepID=A0A9N8VLX3_9GLOM|nr:6921_t:CDS:2 [Acaulospora morrowiae]